MLLLNLLNSDISRMTYNYCVYRSTVSARLCLVVLFCCHMSNDHTDVLFERINDEDDDLVTGLK